MTSFQRIASKRDHYPSPAKTELGADQAAVGTIHHVKSGKRATIHLDPLCANEWVGVISLAIAIACYFR
jgi:hypothetical protein